MRPVIADFLALVCLKEGVTTVGLAENPKKQDIGNVYFCDFVAILNQDVWTHFTLIYSLEFVLDVEVITV